MTQKFTVEIWSDLICPWCWIGKRRFERALAGFANRGHVNVVHRAFRLTPGLNPQLATDLMVQRLGSHGKVAAMHAHVEAEAAKEGLEYHLASSYAGDTLNLHRLVKFATEKGLQEQAIERFYRANFTEQMTVFEPEIQLRLMEEIGLDRSDCAAVLDGDDFTAPVIEDQRAIEAYGQSGVPFFLFAGHQALSGAQSASGFLEALERTWAMQGVEPVEASNAACSFDGCNVPG